MDIFFSFCFPINRWLEAFANLRPITLCSQKHKQHISLIINVEFALLTNSDGGPWAVSITEVSLDLSHRREFIHWKTNRKTTWGL